ncbi:MAG: SEC-C domain-containing protein [Proteobacteria bacterium]|nr:SEC-C domain-containing protein [Pseudomonadota bacterium]MBU4295314.1 SEC-C domain-containing protein [Pseudomonadota bacterium]MCG2748167.1 SEC-C domain-containing protein [Desulfobulbaceae bacterium]
MMTAADTCPCGSGKSFSACCQHLLDGSLSPGSATELMRSRYTAYVVRDVAYILRTWHPSTRPTRIDPHTIPTWNGLVIIGAETDDEKGRATVEFKARAMTSGRMLLLHEKSRFVREKGQWFYVDGDVRESADQAADKPGRNSPCPCSSGRKFKKCCGP